MPWPEIYDKDLSTPEGEKAAREAIDYAVNNHQNRRATLQNIQKAYDDFNGVIDEARKKALQKYVNNEDSKTVFRKYRLGRSKMKQVHGEFLEISLDPSVYTVNPEAQNRKMGAYMERIGMLHSRAMIQKQREMGYKSMEGMPLPENEESIFAASSMKLENELAMQAILNDKMVNTPVMEVFFENWKDLTIASELHCRVERDNDGLEVLRYIQAKHALYEESVFDPFLERSPYIGEIRPMYIHDILSNRNWAGRISDKDREKLKSGNFGRGSTVSVPGTTYDQNLTDVFVIEVKTYDPVYFKVTAAKDGGVPYEVELPNYLKEKDTHDKNVKAGKYTIRTYDRQVMWELVRIGADIYLDPMKIPDTITFMRNGKLSCESSYVNLLFNTTDNVRVSLQSILSDFEEIYDDIRFRINRELRRIKGKVLVFDKAFIESSRISKLVKEITEDGVVTINSAYAMEQGMDPRNAFGVQEFDLGSSNALSVLLTQAMDIERIVDRVTGMNENRQGISAATTTATTNMNNIQASRSMTYDMFYFMGRYMTRALMKLVQKAKLNEAYNTDYREFIYDEKTLKFIKITAEFSLDHYGITITDGKKEKEAMAKAEIFFPQEINARMLRSKDVMNFYTKSSFAEALKVLQDAGAEMHELNLAIEREKTSAAQQSDELKYNLAKETLEDQQQHDTDMEVLRGENKKEQIRLQKGLESVAKAAEQEDQSVLIK